MAFIPENAQPRGRILGDELKIQEQIDRIKRMQEQQRRPDDPEKPIELPQDPSDDKNWRTQAKGVKVAENQLDPRVLRKLESARLPTVPMLAHSKEFVGSMLGKITGPYDVAARILRGAPVESITGKDVLTLGSTQLGGFGRGGGRGILSSGGVRPERAPPEILARMRALRVLNRRVDMAIEKMELAKPKIPKQALKAHSDVIDEMRETSKTQKQYIADIEEAMSIMYGKGWESRSSGGAAAGGIKSREEDNKQRKLSVEQFYGP